MPCATDHALGSWTEDVPVLIVVGGPVGLTTALLLARQGVRPLLVERHPGASIHPRARGINDWPRLSVANKPLPREGSI
jgi:thioredoxin reductase